MGVVGGGGAEVGEGVEVGVGVVAGAGDSAGEKEPLAFSKGGRVSLAFRERSRLALLWGSLLEIERWLGARVWVPLLIRRAFSDRVALAFWLARVRGAMLGLASQ